MIVTTTLRPLPTVGAIQGLAPALRGEANPAVSPGAAEVRFIDHHAFGLIAGNVLQAVAIVFLVAGAAVPARRRPLSSTRDERGRAAARARAAGW